jgi:hypothetical protein
MAFHGRGDASCLLHRVGGDRSGFSNCAAVIVQTRGWSAEGRDRAARGLVLSGIDLETFRAPTTPEPAAARVAGDISAHSQWLNAECVVPVAAREYPEIEFSLLSQPCVRGTRRRARS